MREIGSIRTRADEASSDFWSVRRAAAGVGDARDGGCHAAVAFRVEMGAIHVESRIEDSVIMGNLHMELDERRPPLGEPMIIGATNSQALIAGLSVRSDRGKHHLISEPIAHDLHSVQVTSLQLPGVGTIADVVEPHRVNRKIRPGQMLPASPLEMVRVRPALHGVA
nr:hypothetical protein [Brachybacterium sp. Z12]